MELKMGARFVAWRLGLLLALWLGPLSGSWALVNHVATTINVAASNNISSIQLTNPVGLAAGDLMVAYVAQNTATYPVAQDRAGWIRLLNQDNGGTLGASVFYKFATATDVSNGSVTFTFNSSARGAGALMAFRGVDVASPVNASASQSNASSTALTAPGVTTTVADTLLVALYEFNQGGNSATPAAGMTEIFDGGTGAGPNGVTIAGSIERQAAAGSSGNRVATASTASGNIGILLALTPAASVRADYRFDECAPVSGSVGSVLDASGNSRHATPFNVTSPSPAGRINNALGLAATGTSDYLRMDASALNGLTDFSLSLWFRTSVSKSQQELIHGVRSGTGTQDELEIYLVNSTQVVVNVRDSADLTYTVPGSITASLTDNAWHHLAFTRTGSRGCLYIDGTLVQCRTTYDTAALSLNANGFLAGQEQDAVSGSFNSGQAMEGLLDEVKFFSGVLSPLAVSTIRSNENGGLNYNGTSRAAVSCGTTLHHLRIEYPGDGLTCTPSTVTVKACANTGCTTFYGAGVSGTLAPGGASFAIGTSGQTTSTVSSTTSPATLSATFSPTATNALVCVNTATAATSCSMTFNDAGFIFSGAADGPASNIDNQVAGTSSATSYLRAVRTSTSTRACEAALVGSNTVSMGYQCNNPTTCSGSNLMAINGGTATTIARNDNGSFASSTAVSMTFDANGNAPFTLNYADVGQVTLRATRAAGPTAAGNLLTALTGTSNAFVVRPAAFVISNIRQTAAPQTANPAAADANGARFVVAGESFSASVTATTSTGATTPNYGRETVPEGVLLTPTLVAPVGGSAGALSNGTVSGFSNGVATPNNLAWSEVGIMTLTPSVGDGDYLGAGNVTGTISGNIGRFYPARFAFSAATLTNACTAATPFTYFSEDGFTTAFTLTAQNVAGGTTSNYTGSFAKLALGSWSNYGFSAATLPTGSVLSSSATAPTGSWSNGVAGVTAKHQISRPSALAGETAVTLRAAPTDGEVPASSTPANLGDVTLRYGRLQLLNAYGSELLALPVTLRAQRWNGSAWVTNTDDSCTTITAPTSGAGLTFYPEVAVGVLGNHLSATETTATVNVTGRLAAGDAGLRFSRPGTDNSGFVDISIPLAARPWLQFPWGITPVINPTGLNPTGRATFGIYSSRLIYSRENY
ncbi:MAG: LamG domain-containing protein [Hylemonella sp.]|nr:LamG domain-containing protein [Hylemonella sp.]